MADLKDEGWATHSKTQDWNVEITRMTYSGDITILLKTRDCQQWRQRHFTHVTRYLQVKFVQILNAPKKYREPLITTNMSLLCYVTVLSALTREGRV